MKDTEATTPKGPNVKDILCWQLVGATALILTGCGQNVTKVEQEASNLKPLAVLFGQYVNRHQGQPPQNEDEFKAFVKSHDATALEALGVKDPEALFTSSRDKQPYIIMYNTPMAPPDPIKQQIIAYEQTGVGGKRYVANSLGAVEEVDEAKFRELVPNAK